VRRAILSLFIPFFLPLLALSGGSRTLVLAANVGAATASPSTFGSLAWPLRGPILRGFEQPSSPYASGHRGIDIGASIGTPVHAAAAGVVHFAGKVAGSLFVSIDHDVGLQTTYSWVSEVDVHKGDHVAKGDVVALSGEGHPGSSEPTHLHFGVKKDGEYVDPLLYLGAVNVVDLIHLAPLSPSA
jgi:murein DD-endopeptidase MepM/ murein hydrolase activator NlpD